MKAPFRKKRPWILAAALLSAAGVLAYALLDDKIFAVVEGSVYRSAQLSGPKLEGVVDAKGIQTIVNLRGGSEGRDWYRVERDVARSRSLAMVDIRLPSHALPDYLSLNQLLDVLLYSKRPILVHCWHGADRSGLAGALAMAVLENPPLEEIKKQFSWRYGVLPLAGSIGVRVFSQYEKWLRDTGRVHERDVLVDWIRSGYIDPQANLLFHIDEVNGRLFDKKDKALVLEGPPEKVVVKGWALDAKSFAPPAGLSLSLDGVKFKPIDYRTRRPDVARFYGRDAAAFDGFTVGWTVVFDGREVGPGEHALHLRYAGKVGAAADIPTDFKLRTGSG
jgi:undecaprenyl-diphosphatase